MIRAVEVKSPPTLLTAPPPPPPEEAESEGAAGPTVEWRKAGKGSPLSVVLLATQHDQVLTQP